MADDVVVNIDDAALKQFQSWEGPVGRAVERLARETVFRQQAAKPHKIVAKNAPYLTFFWPKVGRVVHFKSVSHPGNKAYGWAMRGLERALGMWERGG
jgi:hypothetical protein